MVPDPSSLYSSYLCINLAFLSACSHNAEVLKRTWSPHLGLRSSEEEEENPANAAFARLHNSTCTTHANCDRYFILPDARIRENPFHEKPDYVRLGNAANVRYVRYSIRSKRGKTEVA